MTLRLKDLYLHGSDPELVYEENRNPDNLHFGQLKLFITTVAFLIFYVDNRRTNIKILIVGAGGGPGSINNELIASLFPRYKFYMYDPKGFGFESHDNIQTFKELFTSKIAEEWAKEKNVYLISDIRAYETEETKEEGVLENLKMQAQWHTIIRPVYSHLKFRLPFNVESMAYLDGEIMKQPFAPRNSTETRLIVSKDAKYIEYNVKTYEEKMAHHNTIIRKKTYTNFDKMLYPDLIGDYDSTYFLMVCDLYLKQNGNSNLKSFASTILKTLSKGASLSVRRKSCKQ